MARQLDELGVSWERVNAHDMETINETVLSSQVVTSGHRIAMGRGSQCCALTNLDIYRQIVAEDLPAALILQDDVQLSSELAPFLSSLDWLPDGVNVVQFEKYGHKSSSRLVGPPMKKMPVSGRSLHRLHSRTAGAACYLITREGANLILAHNQRVDMPIDHFLFSPNVSPVFSELGVAIVRPALARQRDEDEVKSDISAERRDKPKSILRRLRRFWFEINKTPAQVLAMITGARWRNFTYQE